VKITHHQKSIGVLKYRLAKCRRAAWCSTVKISLTAETRVLIPDFVRRLEIEFWNKWASPTFPAKSKDFFKVVIHGWKNLNKY
jgi:hypothetical protein